ncbi:MAG TPA: 2-hydroxyacyl-CoA dehydratase family protein [Syntrophomonas sp.]|nr:2-hydroxyacyl-CoA dehydratase family protein [Syntrophomonas sp.]
MLEQMQHVVDHPAEVVEQFLKERKRPVIGCAPGYCPEEIVYAAGMLPIGMWGGRTSISKASMYFPAFACSLVQTDLELGMRGVYDRLSAVIIPSHCDHLKCLGQDWKVAVPQVRFISLVHPNNRQLDGAVTYLKSEYARIRREMEMIGRLPVSDADLTNAIEVYNAHRRTMRDFTGLARQYPQTISPRIRHLVIKSGYFMDKAEHRQLVQQLMTELKKNPAEEWAGKRVVLTGIMAEPDGDDPLERLARRWSLMSGCPLLIDPDKSRRYLLKDLVEESGADGVIACMMKFCEPEEFDYPFYRRTMEEAGIPLLHIEVDVTGQSLEQARTRLQSFAEMMASN